MRIRLDQLGIMLLKTCDGGELEGYWVAWCPEFDIMTQGPGPEGAMYMIREALRIAVETDISNGEHPLRRLRPDPNTDLADDADYQLYREFRAQVAAHGMFSIPGWDNTFRLGKLSESVDKLVTMLTVDVDTFGRSCVISDSYNEAQEYYFPARNRVQVRFKFVSTANLVVNTDDHPGGITPELLTEMWGDPCLEIVSVEPYEE